MTQELAFLPVLSLLDPEESTEGSIDPLGLYTIADRLASQLAPGVRERQKHPRMLTAMAVGAVVCSDFEPDRLAADDVSEPWQVFEWHVVEGLVRSLGNDSKELGGLPGLDKTARAIRTHGGLSARTYLKTPGTFGFHGVYRVLAENLGVLNDNALAEFGVRLVSVWEKEQKLDGFFGGLEGDGAEVRKKFRKAIEHGLREGQVARTGGWTNGWEFIRDHLSPARCGKKEAGLIAEALLESGRGYRPELFRFIGSAEGQRAWKAKESEREFHAALAKHASQGLGQLLTAIDAYEEFSRMLTDAFYRCLYALTKRSGKTPIQELAEQKAVRKAARELTKKYQKAAERLQAYSLSQPFEQSFGVFATELGATPWVEGLLEHHKTVQQNKPPNGKNPWVERTTDGYFIIRPRYRQDDPPEEGNEYIHGYRTASAHSFAEDLGLQTGP